jgi:hypothetical protein
MTVYFKPETLSALVEDFGIVLCNAYNKEGLRVFVRQDPDAISKHVLTALAEAVGDDIKILRSK